MKTSTLIIFIAGLLLISSFFNAEHFIEKENTNTGTAGNAVTGFSIADGNVGKVVVGVGMILAVGLVGWFFIMKQMEASVI